MEERQLSLQRFWYGLRCLYAKGSILLKKGKLRRAPSYTTYKNKTGFDTGLVFMKSQINQNIS